MLQVGAARVKIDRWMDGWMDGRTDRQIDRQTDLECLRSRVFANEEENKLKWPHKRK
jgi:hypothetical protein